MRPVLLSEGLKQILARSVGNSAGYTQGSQVMAGRMGQVVGSAFKKGIRL